METIEIRELQKRASTDLWRVRRVETLVVTWRGQLVAVLAVPEMATRR